MPRPATVRHAAPQTWEGRPLLAFLVRVVVVLVPASIGIVLSWWMSSVIPVPGPTPARVERLALILGVSTGVTFVGGRMARRLLPLAALLRLTLVFPDQVPSRFAVSLRRSSNRRLERNLSKGPDDDEGRVAAELVRLVRSLSEHHRPTRGHSERVRAYADLLGQQLGISADGRERLGWAALLHDIGKLAVPSALLDKPGVPSNDEWEVISRHALRGGGLDPAVRRWMGDWWLGVVQHHERWDGTGYPFGLAGTDISLSARIVAVADSFETMTSVRAYKKAMSMQAARTELVRCAGSHFDPSVVRAMLDVNLGSMRSASRLAFLAELPMASVAAQLGEAARASAAVAAVAATTVLGPVTQSLALPAPPPQVRTTVSADANPRPNEVKGVVTRSKKASPGPKTTRPAVSTGATVGQAPAAPATPSASAPSSIDTRSPRSTVRKPAGTRPTTSTPVTTTSTTITPAPTKTKPTTEHQPVQSTSAAPRTTPEHPGTTSNGAGRTGATTVPPRRPRG